MVNYKDVEPIENIGPRESRKRLLFGIAVFIVTVFILIILLSLHLSRFWRLPLFIPFMMSALGFFQSREKICIALAAQGWRNMDDGNEKIMEEEVNRLININVRKITINALLAGIILTVLAFALPQ